MVRRERVALIDTGVLTRAIGDLSPDADTSVCRSFYDAMLDNARLILIAAPCAIRYSAECIVALDDDFAPLEHRSV